MAETWLFWLAVGMASAFFAFFALLALAGYAAMGAVLAAAIVLGARATLMPRARADADDALRHACNRLPFCDCAPSSRR